MKFKFKPEKSNLIFMSSLLILCLMTCLFWLSFREYIYFTIYFVLTLLIGYVYYFTVYVIYENYLVVRLGFINFKFKYENIKSVENIKNGIKINYKNIKFTIYPNNRDIFSVKLNSKIDKQKFV